MVDGLVWMCAERLSAATGGGNARIHPATPKRLTGDARTPFERDFDRLLFSAPVRRMADKTQVFPLDRHDSVRNRLTHSHEVSNLARSIGFDVVRNAPGLLTSNADEAAAIPVMLAAVGLSHDVGNPPFGH